MKASPILPGLLFGALLASSVSALANVKLPRIFGDHMVLQRDQGIPIWGWADPGEKVTVSTGTQRESATTGPDGKWKIRLGNLGPSHSPIEITVTGKNTITLKDVLVGDVWVCSGQSNMDFSISADAAAKEEIPAADYPKIRLFVVPQISAPHPAEEIGNPAGLQGSWQVCTPETLPKLRFSAVGYYFGKNIHQHTGQPVGLIHTSWGGTVVQAWTSLEALQSLPESKKYAAAAEKSAADFEQRMAAFPAALEQYKTDIERWNQENKEAIATAAEAKKQWDAAAKQALAEGKPLPPKPAQLNPPKAPLSPDKASNTPAGLYNGMIAPIVPYALKGVIWYQGESNAGSIEYRTLFPNLITDWRKQWGQGDFPFLFVQLANYMQRLPQPSESGWSIIREAQMRTLSLPNTGMAVTIDIGEAGDIHPKDKWDVGMRLSLAARHVAYGEILPFSGPIYKSMKTEGAKIRIAFDHTNGGLTVGNTPEHFHPGVPKTPAAELQGFAIAGADLKFVWAQAKIEGDTVLVSSEAVPAPVAVRYAWGDNPAANLYNKAGLPASPFRTDGDTVKP